MLICFGLGDFNTSPAGCLRVVDGKVTLDKVKTFNRARLMLNSGCNMHRILRRGIWSVEIPFDWQDEGYWPLMREYVGILHQPTQSLVPPGPGSDVLIEMFDGCSESWMYNPHQYPVAEALIQAMFDNLGDLPYVKFGVGNEMDCIEARAFVRDVAYPKFKANGRKPFSYGASYHRQTPPGSPGPLEWQKYEAEAAWDENTALSIYRPAHGVKDAFSINLTDTVGFWTEGGNPICVIWSVDGVWDGENPCDRVVYNGMDQIRPATWQIKSSMGYWMGRAPNLFLPNGQIKYGFEYIPKKPNDDDCASYGVKAISEAYNGRWGDWPDNFGKYPNDFVPPVPPEPPTPPIPPATDCKCRYWLTEPSRPDIRRWLKCILGNGPKRCKPTGVLY